MLQYGYAGGRGGAAARQNLKDEKRIFFTTHFFFDIYLKKVSFCDILEKEGTLFLQHKFRDNGDTIPTSQWL